MTELADLIAEVALAVGAGDAEDVRAALEHFSAAENDYPTADGTAIREYNDPHALGLNLTLQARF